MTPITNEKQTIDLIGNSDGMFLIYKHSPICDLSATAQDEVNAFIAKNNNVISIHSVDVLASRPASQKIEALSGIRHESPQILLFKEGKCIWNASHRRITVAKIQEALAANA
jgi:bacillithiol system protein YtxJ